MKKTNGVDPDKRLLYLLFRHDLELDQTDFAAATRTAASQVSLYSLGQRDVPQEMLERAADACDFPRALIPAALRAIRSYRAATRGLSHLHRVLAETLVAEMLVLTGEALEIIFESGNPGPPRERKALTPAEDLERAPGLWLRLERRTAGQRVAIVEEIEEYRSPALADLLEAKSRAAKPGSPEVLELAELARRIRERCENVE